jgi:hypothetical protein
MPRSGLTAVALSLCCACASAHDPSPTGTARQHVTHGSADGADPAVVALLDAEGRAICSGTLVGPRVVLTAAHCNIGPRSYSGFRAFFGESVRGEGTRIDLVEARPHPAFEPDTYANDLALLALAERAPTEPVPLLAAPADAALMGATVRVVGYGTTSGTAIDSGEKRQGTAAVSEVGATTITLRPAPSQPCSGDSGGPQFLAVGGAESLAAVTSHGDSTCADHATGTRVDAYLDSFVRPYLESMMPGAARAGERCLFPEHCGGASCVAAADEPRIHYCAPPCSAGASCPAGMTCAGAQCRYPTPTPGAIGSACSRDEQCVGGDCVETGACSRRCVLGKGDCPGGFECTRLGGTRFYCTPVPREPEPMPEATGSAPCAARVAGPSASAPVLAHVVALALAVELARRSRRGRQTCSPGYPSAATSRSRSSRRCFSVTATRSSAPRSG